MEKMKSISTVLAAVLLSSACFADGVPYGSYSHPEKSNDDKKFYLKGALHLPVYRKVEAYKAKARLGGSLILGWSSCQKKAIELEGRYLNIPLKGKSVAGTFNENRSLKSTGILLNALYKPEKLNIKNMQGYLGGGIGFSYNKFGVQFTPLGNAKPSHPEASSTKFTYQLFVGAEKEFNKNIAFNVDLRWIDLMKPNATIADEKESVKSQLIVASLGLKFKF